MRGRTAFHGEDTAKSLRMGSGTETRGTAGVTVLPQGERWGTVGARLEKGAGGRSRRGASELHPVGVMQGFTQRSYILVHSR